LRIGILAEGILLILTLAFARQVDDFLLWCRKGGGLSLRLKMGIVLALRLALFKDINGNQIRLRRHSFLSRSQLLFGGLKRVSFARSIPLFE